MINGRIGGEERGNGTKLPPRWSVFVKSLVKILSCRMDIKSVLHIPSMKKHFVQKACRNLLTSKITNHHNSLTRLKYPKLKKNLTTKVHRNKPSPLPRLVQVRSRQSEYVKSFLTIKVMEGRIRHSSIKELMPSPLGPPASIKGYGESP